MTNAQWLYSFNSFAWITSNVLVAYITAMLIAFVIFYFIVFNPGATTAGKFIFRFMLSLVGVIGLVFIGSFVDPVEGREWFQYPGDVLPWRPIVRLATYVYVSYTITSLFVLLIVRKWWPEKLRTAIDKVLVKPRKDLIP